YLHQGNDDLDATAQENSTPSPRFIHRGSEMPVRDCYKATKNKRRSFDSKRTSSSVQDDSSGAKEAAEKGLLTMQDCEIRSSGAEARADSPIFMRGLKPPPPSEASLSAGCKAQLN
ncbi:MAG: hypothetical protein WBQ94_29440, partial [Terracidiphilus sp.]